MQKIRSINYRTRKKKQKRPGQKDLARQEENSRSVQVDQVENFRAGIYFLQNAKDLPAN